MAATLEGDFLTESLMGVNEVVAAQVMKLSGEITRKYLDPFDLERTRPIWMMQILALIQKTSLMYAGVSFDYLSKFQESETGVKGLDVPKPNAFNMESAIVAMGVAATSLQKKITVVQDMNMGKPPEFVQKEIANVFSQHVGVIEKSATQSSFKAGRETVVSYTERGKTRKGPTKNLGWVRITNSGACDFCKMLAARTSPSAGKVGAYRKSSVSFPSHSNCKCSAEPAYEGWKPREEDRQGSNAWMDKFYESKAAEDEGLVKKVKTGTKQVTVFKKKHLDAEGNEVSFDGVSDRRGEEYKKLAERVVKIEKVAAGTKEVDSFRRVLTQKGKVQKQFLKHAEKNPQENFLKKDVKADVEASLKDLKNIPDVDDKYISTKIAYTKDPIEKKTLARNRYINFLDGKKVPEQGELLAIKKQYTETELIGIKELYSKKKMATGKTTYQAKPQGFSGINVGKKASNPFL